ncbi:MAG: PilZ domain-containing protein [Bdellovibrio sp.]|nr:PilZ domain-containing protein [Bdellovibrio sp.]
MDNEAMEFLFQIISHYGVSGLPSNSITQLYFGKTVFVNLELPAKVPLYLKTRAKVLREKTLYTEHMALKFLMEDDQKEQLSQHIKEHGFYPTEYVRKYPRIPATSDIQTFPLKTIVKPIIPMVEFGKSQHLVMDVINLSPNGSLLSSESQLALQLNPGQKLNLELEARGWFPVSVYMEGMICRIRDDLNVLNGNLLRHFGIKFTKIDRINKAAFMDLLKDILENIKI